MGFPALMRRQFYIGSWSLNSFSCWFLYKIIHRQDDITLMLAEKSTIYSIGMDIRYGLRHQVRYVHNTCIFRISRSSVLVKSTIRGAMYDIYIYIYIERERQTERKRQGERQREGGWGVQKAGILGQDAQLYRRRCRLYDLDICLWHTGTYTSKGFCSRISCPALR